MRDFMNILQEDDFFLRQQYDDGDFPVINKRTPMFSKPFWRWLIHIVRDIKHKNTILQSKHFIDDANPVILKGVYTRPDKWMDEAEIKNGGDRVIKISVYPSTKFAHNGADRPILALQGFGSLWWNIAVCTALNRVGVEIKPANSADEDDIRVWYQENRDLIEKHIMDFAERPKYMAELYKLLRQMGIDILGSGGEFIILNQDQINWDFSRTQNGFKTPHGKRMERNNLALDQVLNIMRQDHILNNNFHEEGFLCFWRTIPSRRILILKDIYSRSDNFAGDYIGRCVELCRKYNVTLGIDTTRMQIKSIQNVDAFLKNLGFTERKGSIVFMKTNESF